MATNVRLGSFLLAIVTVGGVAEAKSSIVPIAHLTLIDDGGPDPVRLSTVAQRVAALFRSAGVELREAATPDVRPMEEVQLYVLIQQKSPPIDSKKRAVVMGLAAEATQGCGRLAYVYYDRVLAYARAQGYDVSVVLVAVIAHEIGHLLLPRGSHTHTGVMKAVLSTADLDAAQRGELGFPAGQAIGMRKTLRKELLRLSHRRDR